MEGIPQFEPIETTVDGHELTLFVQGRDRLKILLDTIGAAQRTLRLFFYIFSEDEVARQVVDGLVEARNRGVKVWLLVDGFGCGEGSEAMASLLAEVGIVFARFYPRYGRRYLLRNHQKMVIADEEVSLIGGTNVSAAYFADDPAGKSWHDLFLRIEGPAAKRLAGYFDGLRRWMLSDRQTLRGLIHILSRRSEKRGPLRWLFNGPFRRLSPLTRTLMKDLDGAQRVSMIEAYFSPNWGMLRRLTRITRRGGDVRIVTAARSDNAVTILAARHCYRRLLRWGVRVFEYQPQMLHMKLIVADDLAYIGSANFDMRSLYLNGEIMLRIDDPGFAEKMHDFAAAHERWSEEITRESHRQRSTLVRRVKWLLSYFLVSGIDFTVTRRISLRRN
jgi:cardiolipin synthase A/B